MPTSTGIVVPCTVAPSVVHSTRTSASAGVRDGDITATGQHLRPGTDRRAGPVDVSERNHLILPGASSDHETVPCYQ